MTDPTVSIIVPTLNVAATLPACLDSIVAQTYRDFELVLVDGGSTDSTLDIAKSVAQQSGIRLVSHNEPDQGPYDAMNRGIAMSSGGWLLFLGADDTLHATDTMESVAAFIGQHADADLVYGDVILRSNGTRRAGVFDLDRLLFETNMCHQSIFYRRALFDGIGPYNLRYKIWADWDLNIRCFSNPALVADYMDIVVTNYNDVSGISSVVDKEFRKRLPVFFWASAMEVLGRTFAVLRRKDERRAALREFRVSFKAK
ncbi:glycosyl transferase [Mycolicibacterium rhodesiae NBB3]|uniref:Glycosyl transferase n=1 Tax=Mycolicibacterium rhodesiae (strain NBB3) TaxID=710685 RepID=G8RIV4_MYCRN|nr:glycosyltransferase family 2 protein [Mycolicibacterium rhodesiae]AEV70942.1 glycosyl transferase [Mycolicibacterium rhodesiae NBB3]